MRQGRFIVIEGIDGSGKSAQFRLLAQRLRKEGYKVRTFDFPQYGEPSAYFVEEYLNGKYGTWREVGPYRASVFYALDRFDIAPRIRTWLAQGATVVANRYVSSNMGHQGAKIANRRERLRFLRWVDDFEFNLMGIPRPALTVVLHVPAKVAYKKVGGKGAREYLRNKKRDIHEKDIGHLKQAERTYLEMVKLFPRDFRLVECVKKGILLPPYAIHEMVWSLVAKALGKH